MNTDSFANGQRITDTSPARWLRFLARWALAAAPVILGLVVTSLGGVGQAASDAVHGPEYAELMQAVRRPGAYRLAMLFDALAWLMIGGTLLVIAAAVVQRAPVRALFVAACGVGQLAGSLGGFMRLNGISELATRYAAGAGDAQAAALQSYFVLQQAISSHFHAGQLLQGAGFLLAAWAALGIAGFPRWLALLVVLKGITGLAMFTRTALGLPFSFPLLLLHVVVLTLGFYVAVAIRLWRWELLSAVAGETPARAEPVAVGL